jgi:hypothetical protein
VQTGWNLTESQRNCIESCGIPEKYQENAMETHRKFHGKSQNVAED